MDRKPDSASELVAIKACPVCGSEDLARLRARSDGLWVLQFQRCKMGVVESHPSDLSVFYGESYYEGSEAAPTVGYADYEARAFHSTSWAAQLARVLRPGGKILDVGCASGFLLSRVGPGWELSGIEVNAAMAAKCGARGIDVIGADICDPKLLETNRGRFDVITAIAVLEHVADLRAALLQIRALLAPGGLLIFEVPLLSEVHDNSAWFSSSLEHIYYPTEEGLRRLFEDVFGAGAAGGELPIDDYGSTFVGVVAAQAEAQPALAERCARIFRAPLTELDEAERTFRFLFDVIHGARSTAEVVALLGRLGSEWLRPELLARVAFLWQRDLTVVASAGERLEAAMGDAGRWKQEAGHWHADSDRWRLEREHWLQDSGRWQAESQLSKAEAAGLQAWIEKLEAGKAFLEEQLGNWQREAATQKQLNEAKDGWIAKLIEARDYHAGQSKRLEERLAKAAPWAVSEG